MLPYYCITIETLDGSLVNRIFIFLISASLSQLIAQCCKPLFSNLDCEKRKNSIEFKPAVKHLKLKLLTISTKYLARNCQWTQFDFSGINFKSFVSEIRGDWRVVSVLSSTIEDHNEANFRKTTAKESEEFR